MSKDRSKYKLGILASGGGTNLQAIIDSTKNGYLSEAEVVVVISDRKNAYALERARIHGISGVYLNFKEFNSREDYDRKIVDVLLNYHVDLVILAGYLKILTSVMLNAYHNNILNIHPSLLPAFGGVNMYGIKVHEAVIAAGVEKSGCSVHVVTEEVDKGPVIEQVSVDVLNHDTPDTLAKRILTYENKLYPEAIKKYLSTLSKELQK